MNPVLVYEFADETGQPKTLTFRNPFKVLQTTNLNEVSTIFEEVERALEKGYYVAGYVSYEAAPAFDSSFHVHKSPALPLVWFGFFHRPEQAGLGEKNTGDYHVSNWEIDTSLAAYHNGIGTIKDAIEHGHTYQVNYTTRMKAKFSGDDQALYQQLTRNQQASYSAYLHTGRYRILSASPELFFQVKQNKITTKPMKGTAPRGRFTKEDQLLKKHLQASEKEQAENLMIVDLLRNDLGRIAKPGSVQVPHLFEVESYPTVHQMTSTIEADLEENITVFDWFQGLFPCGSITGAPKVSTMKYISTLETSARDVYCGAIGYITPDKDAVFNVPIRTVIVDTAEEKAVYGVGGGITWDSTVQGEYEELLTKAQLLTAQRPVFQLLESLKLENGAYPLLAYHLSRLADSAGYFGFDIDLAIIKAKLEKFAALHGTGSYKVRLLVSREQQIEIEGVPVREITEPVLCSVAKQPVTTNDPFLFHKTTNRKLYEPFQDSQVFSTLLWNEDNQLTEFTIGNLVVEQNGKFYTPPIECGLLPGTFRQKLLDDGLLEERVIRKDELKEADAVWFINSVRKWLKVELKD